MIPHKIFLAVLLTCCVTIHSGSQTDSSHKLAAPDVYVGSTPCNSLIKSLLKIPSDASSRLKVPSENWYMVESACMVNVWTGNWVSASITFPLILFCENNEIEFRRKNTESKKRMNSGFLIFFTILFFFGIKPLYSNNKSFNPSVLYLFWLAKFIFLFCFSLAEFTHVFSIIFLLVFVVFTLRFWHFYLFSCSMCCKTTVTGYLFFKYSASFSEA